MPNWYCSILGRFKMSNCSSFFPAEYGPSENAQLFGLVPSFFQPANRNLVGLPSLLSFSSQRGICPAENTKKPKITILTNLLMYQTKFIQNIKLSIYFIIILVCL